MLHPNVRFVAGLLLGLFFSTALKAQTTYTWTGNSSALWSDASNWTPVGVPVDGDSIVFPSGPTVKTVQNNLPVGRIFERVVFNGDAYTLNGNGIQVRTQFSGAGGGVVVGLPISVVAGRTIEFGTTAPFAVPMRIQAAVDGSGTLDLGAGNKVRIAANGAFSGSMTSTGSGRLLLDGAELPSLSVSTVFVHGRGRLASATGSGFWPGSGFETLNHTSIGTDEIRTAALTFVTQGYTVDIDGAVAGTSHDILRVTGNVTLGNVFLLVSGATTYRPAVGQQIVLIDNDGADAVSGTFQSRAEGSTFVLNSAVWRISYVGGTGNDVTITCLESPLVWTGAAGAQWSQPGSWLGGVAPIAGDSLVFPAGAANLANTNNLAPGLSLRNIDVQASGYQVTGNGISPTGSIAYSQNSGSAEVALPLTVNSPTQVSLIGGTGFSTRLDLTGSLSGSGILRPVQGLVRITGAHAFSGSLLPTCSTNCGSLFLDDVTMPAATVSSGSGLFGRGRVGNVSVFSGSLTVNALGLATSQTPVSYGILTTNSISLGLINVAMDLGGATPGTQHGQLAANGTVTLTSSPRLNLRLDPQYRPAVGEVIRLIDNDGTDAIIGTFQDMPENATVFIEGAEFRVSYVGGTGNDMTLTCTQSRKIWTGAVSGLWSNAGNWIGGIPQAGDSVAFGQRANLNASVTNDLSPGLSLRSIWIGQYTQLLGSPIQLQSRLSASSLAEIHFAIDFGNRAVMIESTNSQMTLFGSIAGSGVVTHRGQINIRGSHTHSGSLVLGPPGGIFGLGHLDAIAAPSWNVANNGGWLTGRGRIGDLSSSGVLGVGTNPGASYAANGAGRLHADDVQWTGGNVYLGLDGVIAGVSHDQVRAIGAVSISGTTLNLSLAATHVPSAGQQYVLIDNDGTDAISGTFTGLSNGATTIVSGYQFQVNYAGGTGNDLVLTALNGRAISSTAIATNLNPVGTGQFATLTATVSGVGATPTGTVVFRDGENALGSSSLFNGVATLSRSFVTVGTYVITAEYAGDTTFGGSVSATLNQQVIPRYTLSYSAGTGGTLTGATSQQVNQGGSATTVVAVPNTGYRFVQWSDGNTSASRTDTNVQENLTLSAQFAILQYSVTPNTPANGTVNPSGAQTVNHGSTAQFVLTPNPGYRIGSASGCNGSLNMATYTTAAIMSPCNVAFSFNRNPTASGDSLILDEDALAANAILAGHDDDALTFALATPPTKGTITAFNATTGLYTYVPNANEFGADSFTFTVADAAVTSAPATVSIVINAVNDAPTITLPDDSLVHTAAASGLVFDPGFAQFSVGPANESAQLIDLVTVMSITDPDGALMPGSLGIGTNGSLAYTLTGQGGLVAVQFRVRDNGGGSQNQSALRTFTIDVPFSADLQIAKSNLQDGVVAGDEVLYTIVAANAGPDGVTSARIRDVSPIGLGTIAFACNDQHSSVACPPSCTGNGLADCTVALGASQVLRIDVVALITGAVGSTVSNSATATIVDAGVVSLDSGNDMSTDSDLVITDLLFSNGFEGNGQGLTVPAAIRAMESD